LLSSFDTCLTLRFTHSQAGAGSLITFKNLASNKIFIQAPQKEETLELKLYDTCYRVLKILECL